MQVIGLSLERVKILQRGKQHILTCDHNSMRPRSFISIKTVLPLDGTAIRWDCHFEEQMPARSCFCLDKLFEKSQTFDKLRNILR